MQRRAIMVHGTGGHPDDVGFRWLVLVNSVLDPYGCGVTQGRALLDRLGGTLVVRDDGHFGDRDQPYEEFPVLERLVL